MDTKEHPDVYFNANWFFHKGTQSSSGSTINGRIRMASGPNLETVVTVISGFPVSDLDHGMNAIEFGDNGELYMTSGSHTNGGVPGPLSSSRLLKENFLSAAISVAYMSHPDFNGTIKWSAPDDGNMIASGIDVFGAGLRNPFGLVFHSNGKLYSTDNGPNVGYGRMMTGCGPNQDIADGQRDDELNLITKGNYYGHPNPKRAEFFNDTRQCVWRGAEVKTTANNTGALLVASSARTGMVEFHGNHFGGQLRGNLIMVNYGASDSISRAILNEDGTKVIIESIQLIKMNIGYNSLDVTQAPNGVLIDIRYNADSIFYYKPKEPNTTQLTVTTAFPRRGPAAGGNTLHIYGSNLVVSGGPVTKVTVGGTNCPITSSSEPEIDCTLPGGFGAVDIVVSIGESISTFEKAYRYISGVQSPGFVLPVYTGSKN
jgi:glucose/arabinose dehydrogenase